MDKTRYLTSFFIIFLTFYEQIVEKLISRLIDGDSSDLLDLSEDAVLRRVLLVSHLVMVSKVQRCISVPIRSRVKIPLMLLDSHLPAEVVTVPSGEMWKLP